MITTSRDSYQVRPFLKIRRAYIHNFESSPTLFKRLGGTVGLSSIGMFAGGHGGWGIPIAPPTLMITVGGIAIKPRYVNGNLEPRELLDLTISVDHAVVDGGTAARFTRRLGELLEAPLDITDDAGAIPSATAEGP